MKAFFSRQMSDLSMLNQICCGFAVLVLSVIGQDALRVPAYFLMALFVLSIATKFRFPFVSDTKSRSFRCCGDIVELAFSFWAILAFENDLLFVFVANHCMIEAMGETSLYGGLKQVAILWGVVFCSILRRVLYHSGWEEVVSSALLQLACVVAAIAIGKLIRKARVEEVDGIQELKKRAHSQNTILSTLSHELRTPLTMIKASGEILIEERPGRVNGLQKTFLKTIVRNTIRLIDIAEDILARIKIETTWLRLKLLPLDIRSVVKDVISQISPVLQLENKKIGFTHPKLISTVMADKNWIAQVMMNLIDNAKKNIGTNGRILVDIKENEQFVVVSVSDDGKGIKDENKELVYDAFYSGHSVASGLTEGVGMGLAIVKFVIEAHGGKLYMGSIEGLGTTFSFALKRREGLK